MGEIDLQISFENDTPNNFLEEDKIFKNIKIVLSHIAPDFLKGIEMNLLVCTDLAMCKINLERRGFNKSTDVLSFPLFQFFPPIPYQMIGEIVISIDTLEKQALEIGHSPLDEFYRLLVHGILHLFGYDHETNEEEAIVMRKKEDECLELIFNRNGA